MLSDNEIRVLWHGLDRADLPWEAVKSSEQQYVFESPVYPGQPLNRHAMSVALRGTKHEKCKGKTKTAGLCELLGLAKFTPHDLRRTAATLAGRPRIPRSQIAIALGHADPSAPVVTGVYDQADRTPEAREVLEKVAAEIRRIIDSPVEPTTPDADAAGCLT